MITTTKSVPSFLGLTRTPARGFIPYYQKKNDKYFKPQYFDNVQRQPQSKGRVKYNTQDPLYFDYRHQHINGGIQLVSSFIDYYEGSMWIK